MLPRMRLFVVAALSAVVASLATWALTGRSQSRPKFVQLAPDAPSQVAGKCLSEPSGRIFDCAVVKRLVPDALIRVDARYTR